jgi:hypothetical protein
MRIFKSKAFSKFAEKEGISDATLCEVIREVQNGKIDADYGGGVIKQRVARLNTGKSGGYRVIVLYLRDEKAFFVHGFAKKDQENISVKDIKNFKTLAQETLKLTDTQLQILLQKTVFEEIT